MSLLELPDLIQGTDEWLEQRRGIVTASAVGQLITPATIKPANNPQSRAITVQLAAERITGWIDPIYVNDDMLRGIEDEPRARDKYEAVGRPAPTKAALIKRALEDGLITRDDIGGSPT